MGISRAYAQAAEPGNFFVAGKNKIINGDFAINQRAFSSTTTDGTYGFDRWQMATVGGTTYSAQTFTAGTAPVAGYEGINFARMVTTSQNATTALSILKQKIEDVRTFANQTATISFWAKAGSGTPKVAVEFQQNFGSGGSADVNTYAGQATLSTSWTRYSLTVSVPSISGKTIGTSSRLDIAFWTSAGTNYNSRTGSLGAQDTTIDLWGVQVEAGSVATPFTTATGTLAGELALCERYYQIMAGYSAIADTVNLMKTAFAFRTVMRTSPSVSASAQLQVFYPGVDYNQSSADIQIESGRINTYGAQFKMANYTGLTVGRVYYHNVTNGNILLSAEL